MSYAFMGYGGMLISLPILICQWMGILGLGKANRSKGWWCMMTGVCGTTLGTVFSSVFIGLMMAGLPSIFGPNSTYYFLIPSSLSGLGSLLFAIGFAMHGQQASKTQQRISELESIANAQSEELNRHRTTY